MGLVVELKQVILLNRFKMKVVPHLINAELSLIGEYFEVDLATKKLDISPTQTLIKGEKLKHKQIANVETSWSVATGFEESFDINSQLSKLIQLFIPKIHILNEIQDEMRLKIVISVTVYINEDSFPAIYLEQEVIHFLSNIKAMIDIDLYHS